MTEISDRQTINPATNAKNTVAIFIKAGSTDEPDNSKVKKTSSDTIKNKRVSMVVIVMIKHLIIVAAQTGADQIQRSLPEPAARNLYSEHSIPGDPSAAEAGLFWAPHQDA